MVLYECNIMRKAQSCSNVPVLYGFVHNGDNVKLLSQFVGSPDFPKENRTLYSVNNSLMSAQQWICQLHAVASANAVATQ